MTPTSFELVNGVGGSAVRFFLAKSAFVSSNASCGSFGISFDVTPKNDPSAVPVYSGYASISPSSDLSAIFSSPRFSSFLTV